MSSRTPAKAICAFLVVLLLAAACSGPAVSGAPTFTPSATAALESESPAATIAPSNSASSGASADGVVVTLRVADAEEYRVLLTDPDDIATAEQLLAGEMDPLIPVGTVIRDGDGGVNTGYSWHIDPASFEWAQATIELCDGRPSYVEDGTLSGDTFCPWSAEVVEVEPTG
ncbi:MAG TPA: hypothetical protein VHK63_04280 [Candidatus Limnocylindria bacterium]|nr:hypothetical protein [Candidatus Limnocylindria bacterium]